MKKKVLLFCLCALCSRALCQQVNLGVIAGGNVSTFVPSPPTEPDGTKYTGLFGYHAGGLFQLDLGSVYLQAGLVYEKIGGKYNGEYSNPGVGTVYEMQYIFSGTYSVQYLQIPLNVLYHTRSGKFFIGGGPYRASGLSGADNSNLAYVTVNEDAPSTTSYYTYHNKIDFPNPEFGVNLMAGIRVPWHFIFTGDVSIAKSNKVLNLSAGWMFR